MFHHCKDIKRVPKNIYPQPTVTEKHVCEFCDKQWDSESEIVFHKAAHSKNVSKMIDEGSHVCWTCVKKYESREELCKHIRTMHLLSSGKAMRVEREIFICDNCERVFFNKRMLIIHIANDHKLKIDSNEMYCPKCLKVRTLQNLKMHFYTHLMQSVLSCPICYHKCLNATDFITHVTDVHPKYFHCSICDYNGSTLEIFKKHCEQYHSATSKSVLPSDKYDKSVLPSDKYDKNYVSTFFVPTDGQIWKYCKPIPYKGLRLQREVKICVLCREICESIEDMTEHLLQHTKVHDAIPQKTAFECECGKQFNYKILLKQHQTKCTRTKDVINITVAPAESYILPTGLPFELPPGITLTPVHYEQNKPYIKEESN